MDLTVEHILIMRATKDFMTELTDAAQMPAIPAPIRLRAQQLLNQYPEIPDTTQMASLDYPEDLEPNSKKGRVLEKNGNLLNWLSWYLFSDAKRTQDVIFYAGLAASALGFGAIILYYSLS